LKHITAITILLGLLFINISYASDQIPFGNQVSSIKNYNRATSQIATSGLIGDKGAELLAEHGFKTIIDLRTPAEGINKEKQAAETVALHYINIPVTGEGINQKQLTAFRKAIENTAKPVIVHCASGNRAGAMWVAYRISQGLAPEIAIEEGKAAGMKPEMEQKIRAAFVK
jgi:uncharacterized protein (TIGR01244 family)